MTSKELVPLNGKANLAVIEDPAPLWTATVQAILTDVAALAADRNVFPDDRRAGRQYNISKLARLVDQLEHGIWEGGRETLPELPPIDGDPTQVLRGQKSVLDLTADEFEERWDLMTRTEKLSWIMEVTDK